MIKAYKILLKEIKEENPWGYEATGQVKVGQVMYDFKSEDVELKKNDIVYFQDDYVKKLTLDGEQLLSTNPTNLICQK